MSLHHHHHAMAQVAERQAENVKTVVNTVYVTADPNTVPTSGTTHRFVGHAIQTSRALASSASYTVPVRQQRPTQTSASFVMGSALQTTRDSTDALAAATALSSPSANTMLMVSSSGVVASSFMNAAPIATSGASVDDKSSATSSGMSGGAKAGLAIGIILAIALIAGIAFLCYPRRKRNQEHERLDDEKADLHKKSQSVSSHVSVRRNRNDAPRLSLRPVTQMFPPMSEKQDPSTLIAGSAPAAHSRTPEHVSAPTMSSISSASSNPFDDQDNTIIATPAPAATPIDDSSNERTVTGLSQESATSQAFPTVVGGSRRNSPPGPGPDNVHRVQLDFKPSMDDELELRAGSLVRLLHEYDDGWALCIRLDRSQQGVVPRTCVSKLPVKPRPGPPPGAARGPPPQGRSRPASNAPGPRMAYNGPPRPMGPPGGRNRAQTNMPRQPMGPPQPRPRANSDAMSARRITPPSVSPLNSPATSPTQTVPARKPVPGQAL